MKFSLVLLLVVAAGVALGFGTATLRMRLAPWDGDPVGQDPRAIAPEPERPAAKVALDHEEFDFGTMDLTGEGSHDFVLRNVGAGPLRLTAGDTSCRCTVSTLETDEIPPGGTAKVTLTWKARETTGPYHQTATIFTNDPDRPQLSLAITGEIIVPAWPDPEEMIFSRMSSDETATEEVRLLCRVPQKLEILGFKLADQATAGNFDVKFEPMAAGQLKDTPAATSGVLARVTVKPGLPQGAFRQTILLRTNLESHPALTVAVQGAIGGDISVAGEGWDAENGLLALGTVSGQTGAQRRLLLIVRGPHRKDVKFKPVLVAPDLLKVTVGETKVIGNGAATQTALTIQIPKGTPPADHLGSEQGKLGQVLLETNHPKIPQLRILVRFAIEG